MNTNTSPTPFARPAPMPPPLPPSRLAYTFLPDHPPRWLPRVALFLLGLVAAVICFVIAIVILDHVGRGISAASVFARLAAVVVTLAPYALDRKIAARCRTHAFALGTIAPMVLTTPTLVYNVIVN